MADPLVLINTFEVSHEDAERFIAAWEEAGRPCRSAWYVDTALHQAVTPIADFQFVNIGRWQTAGDLRWTEQRVREPIRAAVPTP